MLKEETEDRIFKNSIIVFLIGFAVFATVSFFLSFSWLLGWVIGGVVSIISFIIGILILEKFSKKIKSKASGFWLGWIRFWIQMIFHATMFLTVIIINNLKNDLGFFGGNISDMKSPINIIAYIIAIGITTIGTLTAFKIKKGGVHGQI